MFRKKTSRQNVTTLGLDVRQEYKNRMITYSVIMLVRIVSIFLILVTPFPLNIIPILIAVFASWFAVVLANNKKSVTSIKIVSPVLELEDKHF